MKIRNTLGRLELINLRGGCYIVRFDLEKDCMHALLDGPWKLFDNYIVAQRWKAEFDLTKDKNCHLGPFLPGLPVEYYREDVIKCILENVSTPFKLDCNTMGVERGKFARATIEIDLTKPLVSTVRVRNSIQRI